MIKDISSTRLPIQKGLEAHFEINHLLEIQTKFKKTSIQNSG